MQLYAYESAYNRVSDNWTNKQSDIYVYNIYKYIYTVCMCAYESADCVSRCVCVSVCEVNLKFNI